MTRINELTGMVFGKLFGGTRNGSQLPQPTRRRLPDNTIICRKIRRCGTRIRQRDLHPELIVRGHPFRGGC